MSHFDIVHLESYRRRRDARFRHARALLHHHPDRLDLLDHLWQALNLTGADRGAVVWLDEYGPGLAHPHTVLDLGADRPRRSFSPVLLRSAWETAVPGLLDLPKVEGAWEKLGEGIASACSVALGSDGPRSWFLVLDSFTPRPPLSDDTSGDLMFLAGEMTSIVLHQDLGVGSRRRSQGKATSADGEEARPRFAGYEILKDLEDDQDDEDLANRIRNRFLVARLIRSLVEDNLVMDSESLSYQLRGIRRELSSPRLDHGEDPLWERVLAAVEELEPTALVPALLEWGRSVEGQGHLSGALEIFDLAYELATAGGSVEGAADAARFKGKVYRTRADWDEALAWYDLARRVAEASGDRGRLATVLDGIGNAYRDLGRLGQARELLKEVLTIGEELKDPYVLAIGHHDLMTVQKLSGDLVGAIGHGWAAVQGYDSRDGRLRALFDLAGVLREQGELRAARDAYSLVAHQIQGLEGRMLALDALAFVAALMGDSEEHERIRARMDEEGWLEVAPVYRGQILFYRGLSCRALGEEEPANRWFREALSFAERHKLNKLIFDAEAALQAASTPGAGLEPGGMPEDGAGTEPHRGYEVPPPEVEEPVPPEILGARLGLREMVEAQAVSD